MDKQQFITGIKASIAEIFERSRDKWVSVREPGASFGAILAANGVNKKYTPPLFDVLTKNGLIERESVGTGVRYRYQPQACATPDLDKLAEKVYEALCAYYAAHRTDGRPKRVTPRVTSTRTETPNVLRANCCLILAIRDIYFTSTSGWLRWWRLRSSALCVILPTGATRSTWRITCLTKTIWCMLTTFRCVIYSPNRKTYSPTSSGR